MWSWLLTNLNWICPLFITIIFSGLNIVVAKCNIKIARQQGKMQNDAFCFQLYEKRMAIYDSVDKILCRIVQNGKVDTKDVFDYNHARKDVEFLFGSDICESYDSILETILRLHVLGTYIEENIRCKRTTEDHRQMCEEEAQKWKLLSEQNKELSEKIKKYISFAEYMIEKD